LITPTVFDACVTSDASKSLPLETRFVADEEKKSNGRKTRHFFETIRSTSLLPQNKNGFVLDVSRFSSSNQNGNT
jgi:hypothetical protein